MDLSHIQESRQAFQEALAPFTKRTNSEANAFGGFIFEDGGYYKVGKWVCHGWLSSYNFSHQIRKSRNSSGLKYILSGVMAPRNPKANLVGFIDWLINRSVWKDVFLDKDAKNCIKFGLVIDAHQPSSLIASACVASRFLTECYVDGLNRREALYYEILDMGFPENEAFLFSQLYVTKDDKNIYPVYVSRFSSGHSVFLSSSMSIKYAKNYLTGNIEESIDKGVHFPSGEGYGSGVINGVWGSPDGRDSFGKLLKQLKPIVSSSKEDLHIFRKIKEEGFSYSSRVDFRSVLEQLKEAIYA